MGVTGGANPWACFPLQLGRPVSPVSGCICLTWGSATLSQEGRHRAGLQLLPTEPITRQHSLATPHRAPGLSEVCGEALPTCLPGRLLTPSGCQEAPGRAGGAFALFSSLNSQLEPRHREFLRHIPSAGEETGAARGSFRSHPTVVPSRQIPHVRWHWVFAQ